MKVELLKPYGKEYGWGTFSSFFGRHTFGYGGYEWVSYHFWPFRIEFEPREV